MRRQHVVRRGRERQRPKRSVRRAAKVARAAEKREDLQRRRCRCVIDSSARERREASLPRLQAAVEGVGSGRRTQRAAAASTCEAAAERVVGVVERRLRRS